MWREGRLLLSHTLVCVCVCVVYICGWIYTLYMYEYVSMYYVYIHIYMYIHVYLRGYAQSNMARGRTVTDSYPSVWVHFV